MTDHAGALTGLRVLDFTRILAGPFATMILGDLGADVVKIERPTTGDDTRAWGPPFDSAGNSTYFSALNRNKRSLVLDLSSDDDRRHARKLAERADVVIENFRPGVMAAAGLSYVDLVQQSPRLIYCSITAFGSKRGAGLPGYDLLVQALGGLMSITGDKHGAPQKVGVALVDVIAGLFAAIGILAALRERESSSKGQHVEIELLTSLLAALANQATAYSVAGVVPARQGNAHPSIAPYELFQAKDGPLVIAVGNDRQFAALCDALDLHELVISVNYRSNELRVQNRQTLKHAIEAKLQSRAAAEWANHLTAVGVPAGQINDIAAAFAFAKELELEPLVGMQTAEGTTIHLTRNPITFSRTPPSYALAPPELGALKPDALAW